MKNFRVTIERRDGTFYCRDIECETTLEATRTTLINMYRQQYHEPADGESHWITRVVEIERQGTVTQ